MNFSTLPAFVAVDMLVRLRRISTLVLLGAMLVVAWLWIPDPSTKQALMVIDGRRALYTSGAIGMATATLATFFIGLFGYYTIASSIARDLRTRFGQIIASTVPGSHEQDPSHGPELLTQIEGAIECFDGDGIYDQEPVYSTVETHSPACKDAVLSPTAMTAPTQRDQHLLAIENAGRYG